MFAKGKKYCNEFSTLQILRWNAYRLKFSYARLHQVQKELRLFSSIYCWIVCTETMMNI